MQEQFIDSLLKTPRISGIQVSPNLKWVVWTWSNIEEQGDVYVVSLEGFDNPEINPTPRKISEFKDDTRVLSWTHDSKAVIVSHCYEGDERFRLYKIEIESGAITPLTEEHPSYFIRGGTLLHDGKHLIYGANYDFKEKKEIEPTIIYSHNLETGERIQLSNHKKPSFTEPRLNSHGNKVIYVKSDIDSAGEQIWMSDIHGKEEIEILNFGDTVKVLASWHPNGDDVIFLCEHGEYRRVGIFNTKHLDTRWVLDDASRNIEDVYVPYGSNQIVIIETKDARTFSSYIDCDTLVEKQFPDIKTLVPLAKLSDNVWISLHYNSKEPKHLVIHDSHLPTIIKKVADISPYIDYVSNDLAIAESYSWKSVDGLQIQGWLYKAQHPKGTIVYVHGGPTHHSEDKFDLEIQAYVKAGFNVLDPNYRGSTGFDLAFMESIKIDGWGMKEQDDILYGIKSLINDDIAEPYKVGITGTSYGGYSAWHAITHFEPEYIAAAVPICGMTDLVVDFETTRPDLRGYSIEMMGGTPEQVPEKYHNGSPINFVQNIKGKLLIVQGAKDPNVTIENVKAVEEKLAEYNIPFETLVFEDEGHGIAKPQNQKVLLTRTCAFFDAAFNR